MDVKIIFLLIKLSGIKFKKGVKLEDIAYRSELKKNMTIEESMYFKRN